MWSKFLEGTNPYEAINSLIKDKRIRKEKAYTNRGYLYIKARNHYVQGVLGTDIKLTFKQKVKILFAKGICVCVGDVFQERSEGE